MHESSDNVPPKRPLWKKALAAMCVAMTFVTVSLFLMVEENRRLFPRSLLTAPLFMVAGTLYDQDNYSGCVSLMRTAVWLSPNSNNARGIQGLCLIKSEKFAEAKVITQEAITLDPKHGFSHFVHGISLLPEAGSMSREKGIMHFKLFMEYPNDLDAFPVDVKAIAEKQVKALDGASSDVLNGLGMQALESGKFDVALREFTRMSNEHPYVGNAMAGMGVSQLFLGMLKEAEASLDKAVELDPRSPFTHASLGYVHLAKKRLKDANKSFEASNAREPGYHAAVIGLGMVEDAKGNSKLANAMYLMAVLNKASGPKLPWQRLLAHK